MASALVLLTDLFKATVYQDNSGVKTLRHNKYCSYLITSFNEAVGVFVLYDVGTAHHWIDGLPQGHNWCRQFGFTEAHSAKICLDWDEIMVRV